MHYTKDMIDNSFAHARSQGLFRKNAVHGEEEARLVLDDTFNNKNEKGENTNLSSHGTFEDPGLVCTYPIFSFFFLTGCDAEGQIPSFRHLHV